MKDRRGRGGIFRFVIGPRSGPPPKGGEEGRGRGGDGRYTPTTSVQDFLMAGQHLLSFFSHGLPPHLLVRTGHLFSFKYKQNNFFVYSFVLHVVFIFSVRFHLCVVITRCVKPVFSVIYQHSTWMFSQLKIPVHVAVFCILKRFQLLFTVYRNKSNFYFYNGVLYIM